MIWPNRGAPPAPRTVRENKMNAARRKRLEEISETIETLAQQLQEVAAEEQEACDNMPENMQGGEKYDRMTGNVSCIEDAMSDLENAKDILGAIKD